jgi:hypothetical protein
MIRPSTQQRRWARRRDLCVELLECRCVLSLLGLPGLATATNLITPAPAAGSSAALSVNLSTQAHLGNVLEQGAGQKGGTDFSLGLGVNVAVGTSPTLAVGVGLDVGVSATAGGPVQGLVPDGPIPVSAGGGLGVGQGVNPGGNAGGSQAGGQQVQVPGAGQGNRGPETPPPPTNGGVAAGATAAAAQLPVAPSVNVLTDTATAAAATLPAGPVFLASPTNELSGVLFVPPALAVAEVQVAAAPVPAESASRANDPHFAGETLSPDLAAAVLAGMELDGPERLPLPVPAEEAEPVLPQPEGSGLLGEVPSFDLAALEGPLQEALDQLSGLGRSLSDWLVRLGPWPWLFLGVAITTASAELIRRRLRQVQQSVLEALDVGSAGLSWLPEPGGLGE